MSSEPTSETSPMQASRKGPGSADASGNQGRGRWTSVAAALGVLAVAGGVAAFLFLSSDPEPPTDRAAPAQGLACPRLREAAEAYEQGDSASFDRLIAQAAEVAEQTLQTSGQVFGNPERVALELDLGSEQRIPLLLRKAERACSAVGR
jgi:hypothetical protein